MTIPPKGLDRRHFLRLGAIASLAPWVGSPAAWAVRALGAGNAISVGYLAGSETLTDLREAAAALCAMEQTHGFVPAVLEELFPLQIVSAKGLPLGDQDFANETVRVGVQGLYPRLPRLDREGILGLDLDVLFAGLQGPAQYPFFAWSLRLQDGPNPSPPTQFVIPIGPTSGLQLRLKIDALPPKVVAEFGIDPKGHIQGGVSRTNFTVDWETNLPRLRRGLYLLALNPATFDDAIELPRPGVEVPMSLVCVVMWVDSTRLAG